MRQVVVDDVTDRAGRRPAIELHGAGHAVVAADRDVEPLGAVPAVGGDASGAA